MLVRIVGFSLFLLAPVVVLLAVLIQMVPR